MSQLLKPNATVRTETTHASCKVLRFLGGGGQGEVYEADLGGRRVALKWYFPHQATGDHRHALAKLARSGPPTACFCWPQELAAASGVNGFGYVMPLREGRYKSIVDLMKRRVDPSLRALAAAGRELAHSFKELHATGLCYRDISFGNVFFDPQTGEVLICDNDNVGTKDGTVGVLGTPGFMAPEIVRREARPSTETDLHSLAVLLFYMLVVAHPLDGRQEASIKCLDLPARERLYGTHPIFIFDPANDTNRPVPGLHDNALATWPTLPTFVQKLFTQAFTAGLRDVHARVREGEWRQAMVALGDCLFYCPACGAEQCHDEAAGDAAPTVCWHCRKPLRRPPRLRLERGGVVLLNHDTRLFPHHTDPRRPFDFGTPVAAMAEHPSRPGVWGLRNDSDQAWTRTGPDGDTAEVPPGRSVALAPGTRLRFGATEGEIVV